MDSGSFENSTDKKSDQTNDEKEQKSNVLAEQDENIEVNGSVSSLIEDIEKNEADDKIKEAKVDEKEQKSDVSSELHKNLEIISLASDLLEKVAKINETDDKVAEEKAEVNELEVDVSSELFENLEVISLVSNFLEEVTEKSKIDDKVEVEMTTKPLSTRLEYLSRPTKDILDRFIDFRLDGALPENPYPSWKLMPLPTKLPFDNCPIPITKRKIGTNLFLPPPANDFDLADENNLRLPSASYENLHDPYVKKYFENKSVFEHLRKEGFITESGKTKCSLNDINRYRVYQRRILAAEVLKTLRDEDEEFKKERAKGMVEQIKEDMQRYREMRNQGSMRSRIKDAVASIKDSSMENQMERDKKVLNSIIRKQRAQIKQVEGVKERRKKIFDKHMRKKHPDDDKRRKKEHLKYAKKDLERLEHLCKVQEEAKLKRREKLDEFWKRKSDWQKEWIEKGVELECRMEEEKKRNIEILERTGKLPLRYFEEQEKGDVKEQEEQEIDLKTSSKAREKSKLSLKSKEETPSKTRKSETKKETIQLDQDKEIDTKLPQEKKVGGKIENLEAKHEEKLSRSEKDTDENVRASDEEKVKDILSDSSLMHSERDESDKSEVTASVEKGKVIKSEINKEIDRSLPEEKDLNDYAGIIVEKSKEKVMKRESDVDGSVTKSPVTEIEDNLSNTSLISSKEDEDDEVEASEIAEKGKITDPETNKKIDTIISEEQQESKNKVTDVEGKSDENIMKLESASIENTPKGYETEKEDNLSDLNLSQGENDKSEAAKSLKEKEETRSDSDSKED